MYLGVFLLILLVIIINTYKKEHFDGIGKSFGRFYYPESCCKNDDCYPGMYPSLKFIWSRH